MIRVILLLLLFTFSSYLFSQNTSSETKLIILDAGFSATKIDSDDFPDNLLKNEVYYGTTFGAQMGRDFFLKVEGSVGWHKSFSKIGYFGFGGGIGCNLFFANTRLQAPISASIVYQRFDNTLTVPSSFDVLGLKLDIGVRYYLTNNFAINAIVRVGRGALGTKFQDRYSLEEMPTFTSQDILIGVVYNFPINF